MAVVSLEAKNYKQSLLFLDKAWEIKGRSRVLYLISRCKESMGIFEEAVREMSKAVQLAD